MCVFTFFMVDVIKRHHIQCFLFKCYHKLNMQIANFDTGIHFEVFGSI